MNGVYRRCEGSWIRALCAVCVALEPEFLTELRRKHEAHMATCSIAPAPAFDPFAVTPLRQWGPAVVASRVEQRLLELERKVG